MVELTSAVGSLQERHRVELDMVRPATVKALRRKLRMGEYHILHFIGHGGFDDRAEDGVLVFEDDSGRGRWVSGQFLGELLRGPRRPLRLAFLNACEGAGRALPTPSPERRRVSSNKACRRSSPCNSRLATKPP